MTNYTQQKFRWGGDQWRGRPPTGGAWPHRGRGPLLPLEPPLLRSLTGNGLDLQCMAGAGHALTLRSKGQM